MSSTLTETVGGGRLFSALRQQIACELKVFWATPVTVLFIALMPVVLYVVFGVSFSSSGGDQVVYDGLPLEARTRTFGGVLVFALMAVAFANVAIGLAIRRGIGLYRRLRTSAASPVVVIAGFLANSAITSLLVIGVVAAIGISVFHVEIPGSAVGPGLLALALGMICFMSLGIALSLLPPNAETAVPIVNVVYFPLAFISGVFFEMPLSDGLKSVVDMLPVRPVLDLLMRSLATGAFPERWDELGILFGWTIIGLLVSARWFRWASEREPRSPRRRSFRPSPASDSE
ncbi:MULTISPECIES: ABC transporter permease [Arthrobacter]|uniref:Transport permease protein n=1 Tax=Arthrobacter terricola TaxID=2547396 RepID=A0A4R5KB89_9MICC|nr:MULTISPECIES: ABC transporter permease [Arthrobacter]MBT8163027.1 ABC transporter permease [Arthrobacter sp. GN70]TDF91768.1 ABC transporter permease [Arthrobacter terricola]